MAKGDLAPRINIVKVDLQENAMSMGYEISGFCETDIAKLKISRNAMSKNVAIRIFWKIF